MCIIIVCACTAKAITLKNGVMDTHAFLQFIVVNSSIRACTCTCIYNVQESPCSPRCMLPNVIDTVPVCMLPNVLVHAQYM